MQNRRQQAPVNISRGLSRTIGGPACPRKLAILPQAGSLSDDGSDSADRSASLYAPKILEDRHGTDLSVRAMMLTPSTHKPSIVQVLERFTS